MTPRKLPQRGVSLIEALVALAVMAVGMLGLVGVQSTLRSNADVSRQRAEAVRLAHQDIEDQRSFSLLVADPLYPTALTYAQIAALTLPQTVADPDSVNGYVYNTTYTLNRSVAILTSSVPNQGQSESKNVGVTVSWTDRNKQLQSVSLNSLVSKVAPDLAATLSVPADGNPTRQPHGRNRGIPPLAKDFGNGTSGLLPPGAPAGVAWRFDNASGVITLCTSTAASTAALTIANISCGVNRALLLQGFVRYQTDGAAQVNINLAAAKPSSPQPATLTSMVVRVHQTDPTTLAGWVTCFMDYQTAAPATYFSAYYCAMPVDGLPVAPLWSADSVVLQLSAEAPSATPGYPFAASLAEVDMAQYKVCRYFAAPNPPAPPHTLYYTDIATPQLNRNYLVINAGNGSTPLVCPPTTNTPPTWPEYPTS